MSITFWSPDAPKKTEITNCPWCDGTGKIGDDDCLDCEEGLSLQVISSLPEISMSTNHSVDYLKYLNPSGYSAHGTWQGPALAVVLGRVQALQAVPAPLVTASAYLAGANGQGRTADAVQRRLAQFNELLNAAIAGGYSVKWG